jgi:hypothetical protein
MRRQDFLDQATGALPARRPALPQPAPHTVQGWNALALRALRGARLPTVPAVRVLAILHTAIYNAWAAYDGVARQTRHGAAVRLPPAERRGAAQALAMSHAAHRVLIERLPSQRAVFDAYLAERVRRAPGDQGDALTPAGIGRIQAASLLDACAQDGARLGLSQPWRQATASLDGTARLRERWCALARGVCEPDDEEGNVLLFFMLANALDSACMATQIPSPDAVMPALLLESAAWPTGLEGAACEAICEAAADEVLRRPGGAAGPAFDPARALGARVVERALACRRGQAR